MMDYIESEKDKWGDTMYFVYDEDHNYFWVDNFNDCRLDKNQMTEFLKKCLDYLKEMKK